MFEGQKPLKLSGSFAGADLSAASNQYKLVKLNADNQVVLCSGTTDVPIGVLQAPCKQNDAADVVVVGETLIVFGASLSAGNIIATNGSAQAQVAVSTQIVIGQVTKAASAGSGNLGTAVINCASPSIKA